MTAPSRKDRKGMKPRRQRADVARADTGAQVEVKQSIKVLCGHCGVDIYKKAGAWHDPDSLAYEPPRATTECTPSPDGRHEPRYVEVPLRKKRVLGALTREEYNERHRR